jgi:hypothetical protein
MGKGKCASQALFSFPVTNKRIKELEHEFLVFLREFIDILCNLYDPSTIRNPGIRMLVLTDLRPGISSFE